LKLGFQSHASGGKHLLRVRVVDPRRRSMWTRRGEPGEWCSEVCRDGRAAVETRQARRVGRPRLKLSAKDRISRRRRQVREAVSRHRLSVIKWRLDLTENKEGLVGAVGIGLKATLKIRNLLIPLDGKNAKNCILA